MKSLCVVLALQPPVLPDVPLAGRTVVQWVNGALDRALPGMPRVSLGPFLSAADMIRQLIGTSVSQDELVLVFADAPFLRPDVLAEMLALHREYRADYTFADGFPLGLTAEIVCPAILPVLQGWAVERRGTPQRDTFFQLLSTDINRFDVETYLSPLDLRTRRLSLTSDSRRNRLLLDRYAPHTGLATAELLAHLASTEQLSRTLPATLHVQITGGVAQVPIWSPVLQFTPDALTRREALSRARWNQLLDRAIAWAGDLTVIPSFWGEPSLHPEITDLLTDALMKPGVRLVVETSGLGWQNVDLEALAQRQFAGLDWIVELDSNEPATYQAMRGQGFAEAQGLTRRLLELFPGHVWPQSVRMNQNEHEMESFFQYWKKEAGQVIIQKHNDFGGRLARAKPSDLSPWKRHSCWHLARDLAVFLDGTTVVCRDDVERTRPLGNLWSEEFDTVWARGNALFSDHVQGVWPGVCQNCDEWYTFHF